MNPLESSVCHRAGAAVVLSIVCGCVSEAREDAAANLGSAQLALTAGETASLDRAAGVPRGGHRPPRPLTFTTLFQSPLVIEGLAADAEGQLYTAGRAGTPCPVWRVDSGGRGAAVVGNIGAPCSSNGLAFDADGRLYVASTDKIYRLVPNEAAPPSAEVFAAGLPGANGLTFDTTGNLWVSDGTSAQGRVWTITPGGEVTVAFRVQALASTVNVVEGQGGIGRDVRALPPGRLNISDTARSAADTAGSQPVVANGLAFTDEGDLLVADTARGAIWRARFDSDGSLVSDVGCDAAFPADTLCLDELFVAHPALEGVDGIVIDRDGAVWATAHERNAVLRISTEGDVREAFRNPIDPVSSLRNGGPLEFPTTPLFVGGRLCLAHSDQARRDNFPNGAGEVGPGLPWLGKVSCSDE